ncbi:hypothetical protein GcM1_174026 [Golovinomyces cichoracearum]|uniref:Uncharacterized protein n=1 Tax=Golovinomyces cichoracearum TaxID=62708 RepID=A0A420J5Z4_9PEZI|nr:hypothetical protein GcM1_174026 [Golovinomyces cichoracearum]
METINNMEILALQKMEKDVSQTVTSAVVKDIQNENLRGKLDIIKPTKPQKLQFSSNYKYANID